MLVKCSLFLIMLDLIVLPQPARSIAADAAPAPTLVVRISSLDGVIADVKYLLALAGHEEIAKGIDDELKKRFPKGFVGVDTKRPLGAYGTPDPDSLCGRHLRGTHGTGGR